MTNTETLIEQLVQQSNKKAVPLEQVQAKLKITAHRLQEVIEAASERGYQVHLHDGMVYSKVRVLAERTLVVGSTKPGRYAVGYWSDTHFGCRHSDLHGMREHRARCYAAGATVMVHTGDLLDGNRPVLIGDQDRVGFDSQLQELLDVVEKGPPLIDIAIDGNHDGYYSSAIGTASGRLVASAMKEHGRDWRFAGVCEGRACIHGADWWLWHPAGGSTDKLGVLKVLRDKLATLQEHTDIVACGHLHKFASANLDDALLVCTGTYQRKLSEFANRISGPWDVGGSIVSYDLDRHGVVTNRAAQWYPSRQP